MSIRPTNGALRTAPRSSTPISISPSPAAALKGSTASRSWSGRRRRFPSCSPTPPRRFTKSAMCCLRARACSWDRREWSRSATPTDALPPSASTTVSSWSATRVEILGSYDKVHLVPFGEYLPFQDFMESLGFLQLTGIRGGFSAGTGPRLLPIPGAPPARPLICYEIIFPDEVADNSQRPGWFLNVTNDAWFGTERGSLSAFSSGTTSRRRARLAGGARGQHRHLGDHRSLRTRARRARSEAREESSTGFCPRLCRLRNS